MSDLRVLPAPPVGDLRLAPPVVTTKWLTVAEAADALTVSENKFREMRAAWKAAHPCDRIERRIGERGVRFTYPDLERLSAWWSDELDRRANA